MAKTEIIRIEQWDRRHKLTKQYGLRAAIVYEGTEPSGHRRVACDHRLRVKQWANTKLGPPCHLAYNQQYENTNSPWYQGYNRAGEYVIAFRDAKQRDWALLL